MPTNFDTCPPKDYRELCRIKLTTNIAPIPEGNVDAILVIGQASEDATGDLYPSNIYQVRAEDRTELLGDGSPINAMLDVLATVSPDAEIWVYPVEFAGSKGEVVFTITGADSLTGVVDISGKIDDQAFYVSTVGGAGADNQLALDLGAQIQTISNGYDVVVAGNVVTVTTVGGGTVGGDIHAMVSKKSSGLTVDVDVTKGAGGVPDLSGLESAIPEDMKIQHIINPFYDPVSILAVDEVVCALIKEMQGTPSVYTLHEGTIAQAIDAGINSAFLTLASYQDTSTPIYKASAALGGALYSWFNTNSDKIPASANGMGLQISDGYSSPRTTRSERSLMVQNGIAYLTSTRAGLNLGRAITNNTTDVYGANDASLADLNTVAQVRKISEVLIDAKEKVTAGKGITNAPSRNKNMVSTGAVISALTTALVDLQDQGILGAFPEDLIEANFADGCLNVTINAALTQAICCRNISLNVRPL